MSTFSAKCHVCARQRVKDPSERDAELRKEQTAGMTRGRRRERERKGREEGKRERSKLLRSE